MAGLARTLAGGSSDVSLSDRHFHAGLLTVIGLRRKPDLAHHRAQHRAKMGHAVLVRKMG